jgi:acyl transferase domain-containing protein
VNGPRVVVVSGSEADMDDAVACWIARERKATRLRASDAFRSRPMEPVPGEFRTIVDGVASGCRTTCSGLVLTAPPSGRSTWPGHPIDAACAGSVNGCPQ